jgi:hypothetical protein
MQLRSGRILTSPIISIAPKPSYTFLRRLKREMDEFSMPEYAWMIKAVDKLPCSIPNIDHLTDTIRITLHDDTILVVHRSENILNAPRIVKEGCAEDLSSGLAWYPSLTSIKWLMMVLYVEKEP